MNKDLLSNELWAAAQLTPGEGIEDGVNRIENILARIDAERGKEAQEPVATKLETQPFSCFHVSAEDAERLRALPVGTQLFATPQQPAPFPKRPYNGRAMSVQEHDEIVEVLQAKIAEQDALIEQCEKALTPALRHAVGGYVALEFKEAVMQRKAIAAIAAHKSKSAP